MDASIGAPEIGRDLDEVINDIRAEGDPNRWQEHQE